MQTTYTTLPTIAFAGMLGDSGAHDVISRAFDGATDAAFGLAVVEGPAGTQCELPDTDSQLPLGVLVHKHRAPLDTTAPALGTQTTLLGVTDGDTVSVLRKGRIWVQVEEAITMASEVWFRHTDVNGTTKIRGGFRTDTDGGDADQILGAKWLSVTAGAGIALLDLNLP